MLPGLPKSEGDSTSRAGYSDWISAVSDLCSTCKVAFPESLPGQKDKRESILIDKAQECKQTNPDGYYRKLIELYGTRGKGTRPEYYTMLRLPFKAIITTNFDPLLADAAKLEDVQVYAYPELSAITIGENQRSVYYIHGIAERNGSPDSRSLVFARSEYDQAYSHQFGLTSLFLKSMFLECRILFIGAEPDSKVQECIYTTGQMKGLMNGDSASSDNTHNHNEELGLILLPERYTKIKSKDPGDIIWSDSGAVRNEALEEKEDQEYKRLGFQIVRYRRFSSHNHDEIRRIFDEFHNINQRQLKELKSEDRLPDA